MLPRDQTTAVRIPATLLNRRSSRAYGSIGRPGLTFPASGGFWLPKKHNFPSSKVSTATNRARALIYLGAPLPYITQMAEARYRSYKAALSLQYPSAQRRWTPRPEARAVSRRMPCHHLPHGPSTSQVSSLLIAPSMTRLGRSTEPVDLHTHYGMQARLALAALIKVHVKSTRSKEER